MRTMLRTDITVIFDFDCNFCLLPLALLFVLCTRNNTDGNKLVIFSHITLYYGDNYIVLESQLVHAGTANLVGGLYFGGVG